MFTASHGARIHINQYQYLHTQRILWLNSESMLLYHADCRICFSRFAMHKYTDAHKHAFRNGERENDRKTVRSWTVPHFCDKQLHADSIEFDFDFRFKAYEFGAVKSICSAMKTRNHESFQQIETSNGIIGRPNFFYLSIWNNRATMHFEHDCFGIKIIQYYFYFKHLVLLFNTWNVGLDHLHMKICFAHTSL